MGGIAIALLHLSAAAPIRGLGSHLCGHIGHPKDTNLVDAVLVSSVKFFFPIPFSSRRVQVQNVLLMRGQGHEHKINKVIVLIKINVHLKFERSYSYGISAINMTELNSLTLRLISFKFKTVAAMNSAHQNFYVWNLEPSRSRAKVILRVLIKVNLLYYE